MLKYKPTVVDYSSASASKIVNIKQIGNRKKTVPSVRVNNRQIEPLEIGTIDGYHGNKKSATRQTSVKDGQIYTIPAATKHESYNDLAPDSDSEEVDRRSGFLSNQSGLPSIPEKGNASMVIN